MNFGVSLGDSFDRLLIDFSAFLMGRGYVAETRSQYVSDIRYFLLFVQKQGVGRIARVDRNHIEAFLADYNGKGYAVVSSRRKLSTLKLFFTWLKQKKLILGNPAAKVIPPHYDFKLPRVLTKAEYTRLLEVVDDARDKAIIELILQTGIRVSEAHYLNLAHVSIPEPITEKTIGRAKIAGRDESQAFVYLNAKACKAIDNWFIERPLTPTDALFVSRNSNRLSRRQMQRMVCKNIEKAGLEWATVKALRHSFAAHHLVKGTPIKQVKNYLGHKDIRSTQTLYMEATKFLSARYLQENGL